MAAGETAPIQGRRVNFFKLYMGDYQRDTGALSIAEHGAYFLMLQYHYATEKPLPKGKDLYRMLRCESKAERDAVDTVAGLYWTDTPEGWTNNRAAKEIEKAGEQADTNRRIAQAREDKRKVERIVHEACSVREPSHSQNQSTSKPKVKSEASAPSPIGTRSLRLGEGPVLETIPLIGEAVAEICESHVAELERLYPAVDPLPTLREIRGWNLSHPTQRKTSKGISAHINSWFQRDQNRG